MPPKPKFSEGDRVLCFHGPLLYEAKCVKCEVKDKSIRHLIHYNGWNKSWDEWVPESRVLKYSDAGLQRQKELKRAHLIKLKNAKQPKGKKAEKEKEKEKGKDKDKDKEKEKEKGKDKEKEKEKGKDKEKEKEKELDREQASTPLPEAVPHTGSKRRVTAAAATATASTSKLPECDGEPKKKRIRNDPTIESAESYMTKMEIKVKIPDELKPWLLDDWDLINRQKQLLHLPANYTVDKILDDHLKTKLSKSNYQHKDAITEVTSGIREYFNVMLGTQLLYKFERPQYAEILADHPDVPMSEIYGGIHLLRLFVKLGGMLAFTQLDERGTQLLMKQLQYVLKYMVKNAYNIMHVSNYYVAPPEYHRKAI